MSIPAYTEGQKMYYRGANRVEIPFSSSEQVVLHHVWLIFSDAIFES